MTRAATGLAGFLFLFVALAGCGTIGPPIAPEDVGVGPLIERQKALQTSPSAQGQPLLDSTQTESPQLVEPIGQDQDLPPLRPVGTR